MNNQPIPRAAAVSLLALALAAAGCPSDDGTCESSAACEARTFCFEGRCVASLPAGEACGAVVLASNSSLAAAAPPATCNPSPDPVAPSLPAGWVLPLEVDGVADTDFGADPTVQADTGQTVSFTLPAGITSLTIHHQGITAPASFNIPGFYYGIPNAVTPTAIRSPSGGSVFDDPFLVTQGPIDPSFQSVSYPYWSPWGSSLTLPQTSRLFDLTLAAGELPAGRWSFQVSDWNAQCASYVDEGCEPATYAPSTYDVAVVARPGPFVSTGTLDVAIYLVGKPAGTAAAVVANPSSPYRRLVWALGQLLGRGGICLGTVTFFDGPSGPSVIDPNDSPPCSDLSQLFSLASRSVDGVHLFLVDTILSDFGIILGIDGSIPGPSGLPGAVNSGAAMINTYVDTTGCVTDQFDPDGCDADMSGYIAAHEIGHWLGLYHTTERTGEQYDPLDDTPSCNCDCSAYGCDPYGSSMVSPLECIESHSCGGGDNLMFWAFDEPVSKGYVTAEQGLVMRVNPAVK